MTLPSQIAGRILALLAAFAAVMQWSVPHGWMISEGLQGNLVLAPCPATSPGLVALVQASDGHAHHHHHEVAEAKGSHSSHHDVMTGVAETLCDQAAIGVPALPPSPPVIAGLTPATNLFAAPISETVPGRGLAAPPPPSTGPPLLTI